MASLRGMRNDKNAYDVKHRTFSPKIGYDLFTLAELTQTKIPHQTKKSHGENIETQPSLAKWSVRTRVHVRAVSGCTRECTRARDFVTGHRNACNAGWVGELFLSFVSRFIFISWMCAHAQERGIAVGNRANNDNILLQ